MRSARLIACYRRLPSPVMRFSNGFSLCSPCLRGSFQPVPTCIFVIDGENIRFYFFKNEYEYPKPPPAGYRTNSTATGVPKTAIRFIRF